jgi:hypothetical protein
MEIQMKAESLTREQLLKENKRLDSIAEEYMSKYKELETAVRRLKIARAEASGIRDAEVNLYGLL